MKLKTPSEYIVKNLRLFIAVGVGCLLIGCGRDSDGSKNSAAGEQNETETPLDEEHAVHQRALEEAVDSGDKDYEERMRSPPTNQLRLPNPEIGPGRPFPQYVNFYTMDERFPAYLLCEYPVSADAYDQSKEAEWFKAALLQIRHLGPQKFPAVKWIAVSIFNFAEANGASTFEQSFKVGAVFRASMVFDSSTDLSQLVSQAELDRHPFKYDSQQPTPGEQQRWVIVERHAATNLVSTNGLK
jgi:hypothetical protein